MLESETRIILSFIADLLSERDDRLGHLPIKKGKRSPRKKRVYPKSYPSSDSDHATPPNTEIKNHATNPIKLITSTYFISNELSIFKNTNVEEASGSSKISLVENPNKLFTSKTKRLRTEDDQVESAPKKKKAKRARVLPPPLPPIPEVFKNHILGMGGCLDDLKLVIMKELTNTDLSGLHGRLSIPYLQVRNPQFVTPKELGHLDHKAEIMVTLIEPSLEECQISFRSWKSLKTFVLCSSWNAVCGRNQLRPGNKVQLWSFRRNYSELCFALVLVD